MKTSVKVLVSGVVLLVGAMIFGVGGTVIGMIHSFNNAAASSGSTSPDKLAEGIGNSLISTAIGVPVAVIGLSLIIGGIVAYFVGKNNSKSKEQQQESA